MLVLIGTLLPPDINRVKRYDESHLADSNKALKRVAKSVDDHRRKLETHEAAIASGDDKLKVRTPRPLVCGARLRSG